MVSSFGTRSSSLNIILWFTLRRALVCQFSPVITYRGRFSQCSLCSFPTLHHIRRAVVVRNTGSARAWGVPWSIKARRYRTLYFTSRSSSSLLSEYTSRRAQQSTKPLPYIQFRHLSGTGRLYDTAEASNFTLSLFLIVIWLGNLLVSHDARAFLSHHLIFGLLHTCGACGSRYSLLYHSIMIGYSSNTGSILIIAFRTLIHR